MKTTHMIKHFQTSVLLCLRWKTKKLSNSMINSITQWCSMKACSSSGKRKYQYSLKIGSLDKWWTYQNSAALQCFGRSENAGSSILCSIQNGLKVLNTFQNITNVVLKFKTGYNYFFHLNKWLIWSIIGFISIKQNKIMENVWVKVQS